MRGMEENSSCPWWNISCLHYQSLSSSSNTIGLLPTRNIENSSHWVAARWTAPCILCVLSGSVLGCRRSIRHFYCLCFDSTNYVQLTNCATRALSAEPCKRESLRLCRAFLYLDSLWPVGSPVRLTMPSWELQTTQGHFYFAFKWPKVGIPTLLSLVYLYWPLYTAQLS